MGFASGGKIPGIGSADTVPAMLTPGEFVIKKDRSEMFRSVLEMINYAPLPTVIKNLGQHLNIGGLVMPKIQMPQIPTLKFAEGGAVPSASAVETVNFNWNINGQ